MLLLLGELVGSGQEPMLEGSMTMPMTFGMVNKWRVPLLQSTMRLSPLKKILFTPSKS